MSRTSSLSKLAMAGAVAFAFAAPAFSQDADLEFKSLLSGQASADSAEALRDMIRQRVLEIATTPEPEPARASATTIGEIDELNRSAERAKAELELERTRSERRQMQLQELIGLYETLDSIQKEPPAPAANPANPPRSETAGPDHKDEKPEAFNPAEIDFPKLPRIDAIMGAAGKFEVYVLNPDATVRAMRPGDRTHTGFELVEATYRDAVFKSAATGQSYRLVPQSEPEMESEINTSGIGVMAPRDAIDLSKLPMTMF